MRGNQHWITMKLKLIVMWMIFIISCTQLPLINAATSTNFQIDPINKVHVVFMNHLDVGYSDGTIEGVGYAIDVINRYFTEYFPRAVTLPISLREGGYQETFIYTTHPWLVSLYLNCPDIAIIGIKLKCPTLTELNLFADAIKNGTITWHAGPMNMQTDNMGTLMFKFSLTIAKSLDSIFGINRTHATYSQRDVPGLTKATIPILKEYNVKAISVGVNPGTAPPAVPSPFVWKLNDDDKDGILAFWGKGGYPINPGPDPASPGGLARDKCVITDGLDEALCFAFRTDNTGPPEDVAEILSNYEILRAEFPNAKIVASTFDNFVSALDKVRTLLPSRSFEIGDTWIQGIASDPFKISMYRAFIKTIEECGSENCSFSDSRIFNALQFLLKVPEHTWGAHNFLNSIDWSNTNLARAIQRLRSFQETELTWHEQRQFIYLAIKALGDHPIQDKVTDALSQLTASVPSITGYYPAQLTDELMCNDGKILKIESDGSLSRLYDPVNKRDWASPSNRLGQVTYNTYTEAEFLNMSALYNYDATVGFDKPNITVNAHPEEKQWPLGVISLYNKADDPCDMWLQLVLLDFDTPYKYGAPKHIYIHYQSTPKGLNATLIVANKTMSRLPESLSFAFSPKPSPDYRWLMEKMNKTLIDPCNVVLNGSQYVHAVSSSVRFYNKSKQGLKIVAHDSPLVQLGTSWRPPSPFPVPLSPIPCGDITTMAFNLHNNIWNTNYIYWYPYTSDDSSFKSRFSIEFR